MTDSGICDCDWPTSQDQKRPDRLPTPTDATIQGCCPYCLHAIGSGAMVCSGVKPPVQRATRAGHGYAVAAASALFRSAIACCSAKISCRLPSQRLLASHSAESTIAMTPASLIPQPINPTSA
jgi:hypothetical protein